MGEAAALIAAFTWSATSVVMASLTARTAPAAMSALRLATATLLLPFVLLFSGEGHEIADISAPTLIAMVGSGLLAYAIGDTIYIRVLGSMGIQRAFPISMSLFIVLSVAGGIVLLGEDFAWTQAAGAVLTGAGIWLIVRGQRRPVEAAADEVAPVGLVRARRRATLTDYALLGVVGVTWAAATLWLAKGREDLGSVAASAIRTPAGAAGMLTFAMVTSRHELARPFADRGHIGAIVAVGIAGTLFGSLLYVYAVGEAGAARTTVLNAASPLLALPLSVLVLKEPFTRAIALGTAICVVGIALVVV